MEGNEAQSEGTVKEKGDRQKAMSELGICKLTAACTVKYSTVPASILDQISHILLRCRIQGFFKQKYFFVLY